VFRSLSLLPFGVLKVVVPVLALGALGTEAWIALSAEEQEKQAGEIERELDLGAAELHQRHEAKQALVTDLTAGRTTLAEVTAQFMLLNYDRPACMDIIRRKFPGATDEEKMARNVLAFVDVMLSADPSIDRAAVRARLDAELASMLDPHPSPTRE